jgi:gliding motility-associated-like protein
MKNQFEQHIKQSLENYEVPYNPSDWADLQNRLSKVKAGKSNIGKGLMIAASVAAVAGAIYFFNASDSKNNKQENAVVPSQNIVQNEVKENPVQQTEVKDKQPVISHQSAVSGDNSSKEKAVATTIPENKSVSSEKTETQAANNIVENKSTNQQQAQPLNSNSPPSNISAPKASFHSDVNKVCEGASVQFAADNSNASFTYKWSFGNGESSAEQNPKYVYSEAGTYLVKLRVTSVKDNKSDEQKNTVTVLAAPSLKMNYSASNDNDLLINFNANADKVTEWKWDFGDKQSSAEQNPLHTYNKKGNYAVSVTAKNNWGCSASVKQIVNVENNLLAPTGFSPNGDGHNDTWIPAALTVGDKDFTLTIYNISGNPVFTTSDKNHPWDGQNTNVGDTFSWKVVIKEKNGEESKYQGLVTIAP